MSIGLVILVVLVILLFGGGLGPWQGGPYWGAGHYGGIGIGTVLVIVLILVLLGKL